MAVVLRLLLGANGGHCSAGNTATAIQGVVAVRDRRGAATTTTTTSVVVTKATAAAAAAAIAVTVREVVRDSSRGSSGSRRLASGQY